MNGSVAVKGPSEFYRRILLGAPRILRDAHMGVMVADAVQAVSEAQNWHSDPRVEAFDI